MGITYGTGKLVGKAVSDTLKTFGTSGEVIGSIAWTKTGAIILATAGTIVVGSAIATGVTIGKKMKNKKEKTNEQT